MSTPHSRRTFLSGVSLALPFAGCRHDDPHPETPTTQPPTPAVPPVAASVTAAEPPASVDSMPKRDLGKTGVRVSMLGLGGFHIGKPDEATATRIMHRAIEHGLTFFDNCWDYN